MFETIESRVAMSLGFGIFLIVVGAVLTFALNVTVSWIDLHLVGWILMAAGLVIVIIGIVLIARKRTSVVINRSAVDPKNGEQITQTERKDDQPY